MSHANTRSLQLSSYVAGAQYGALPAEVIDAARMALVDYLGVSIAGCGNEAVVPVRRMAQQWGAAGQARMFLAGRTTPALAALVNGTMTHAMDLDDIHYLGGGHPSGPCWSAALALAEQRGADERRATVAFVTGYEVMARLGGGGQAGVGRTLQHRGFHPTSLFGRAGAAAAGSVVLGLDAPRTTHALGVAATTAGGLLGSFGTHAKPFHSGKAAMDGIMAAELAEQGFIAKGDLYETDRGLLAAFLEGRDAEVPPFDFEAQWYLLENGFKRFGSCRATHASAEAAQSVHGRFENGRIRKITASVNPIAVVCAANPAPGTGLEGRFSVPFCIALALNGYRLDAFDFSDERASDPAIVDVMCRVELEACHELGEEAARLRIELDTGQVIDAAVDSVTGHHKKPLGWDGLHGKFMALAIPALGQGGAEQVFELAASFDRTPGAVTRLSALLAGR